MQSHDHGKQAGVRWVSWKDFSGMTASLTERLAAEGVSVIVGVARGGLFPATAVACALRCEMYPVRVTRRFGDQVVHDRPVWKVPVADEVGGRVVAVVDEIADSGDTLALVSSQVLCQGASRVVTAALVAHSWVRPAPAVAVLSTDEFIVFPWDQRVFVDGRWQAHPEVLRALGTYGTGSGGDDPAR